MKLKTPQEIGKMTIDELFESKIEPERYRVNVLHRGKERWKYCRTIKRARLLQQSAIDSALDSQIYRKIDGKYIPHMSDKILYTGGPNPFNCHLYSKE